MSVHIARYKDYINKLQDDGNMADPTCTYDYAKEKLLQWEDLINVHESFGKVILSEPTRTKANKYNAKDKDSKDNDNKKDKIYCMLCKWSDHMTADCPRVSYSTKEEREAQRESDVKRAEYHKTRKQSKKV
jgi:hypothetical protein